MRTIIYASANLVQTAILNFKMATTKYGYSPYLTLRGSQIFDFPLYLFVCWSLTSLCHSNGHIETMPAREINPFTALTRIRSQFLRTQWSTSNHSEWTRLRLRPLSHRGWWFSPIYKYLLYENSNPIDTNNCTGLSLAIKKIIYLLHYWTLHDDSWRPWEHIVILRSEQQFPRYSWF